MKKKFKTAAALFTATLLMAMPVYAGEPTLVTGTQKLISQATLYLAGFVAGITGLIALVNGIKMQTAEEEEKPKYKKALKNTIIIGVVIATISGTISWIFSFYGAAA